MELQHLIDLIQELPNNSDLQYIRESGSCVYNYIEPNEPRIYAKTQKGKDFAITGSYIRLMASRIEENVPFNISQLMNNSGSNRPVIETIIAHTKEFYRYRRDNNTYVVWIPSKPHSIGEINDWNDDSIIKEANINIGMSKTISQFLYSADNKSYSEDELADILRKVASDTVGTLQSRLVVFGLRYGSYVQNIQRLCDKAGIKSTSPMPGNVKAVELIKQGYLGLTFYNPSIKYDNLNKKLNAIRNIKSIKSNDYLKYIAAIRTKPFLLLAGISGSGKSRIVRELARACWPLDSDERKAKKPKNYELIQVKPNWHDSSELIGYVSRIKEDGEEYVYGKFLPFVAQAWKNLDTPYFLCLDEMNLAPVEQYFAEYLSVIETRKLVDGEIKTDPIIESPYSNLTKNNDADLFNLPIESGLNGGWYENLIHKLSFDNQVIYDQFKEDGIAIPPNLIVVGTVNMDETTFTFSRKVLDRAMTIEMNEVDLEGGLEDSPEDELLIEASQLIGDAAEGKDVYAENKEVCDMVIAFLKKINAVLEGTPFKIGYRARNEFLMYAVNRLMLTDDEDKDAVLNIALDEMTSMKILSRIEGDDQRIKEGLLTGLEKILKEQFNPDSNDENSTSSISLNKIKEMKDRLKLTGFTSFWS